MIGGSGKARKGSSTLLVTFLFGLCIGLSILYAMAAWLEIDFSDEEGPIVEEVSSEVVASPPMEVVEPPVDAPATPASEVASGTVPAPLESVEVEEATKVAVEAPVVPEETLTIVERSFADLDGVWPARHLFVGVEGTVLGAATRQRPRSLFAL